MSVNFTATALIGVELDKSKTYKMIKERGCEHKPSENKFCAECGEPMWNEREVVIEELRMLDDDDKCYSDEVILEDYQLAFTTDQNRVFLGKQASTYGDDEAKMIALPYTSEARMIAHIRKTLMNFLEPLNLWDETKFGIWAIAYASY